MVSVWKSTSFSAFGGMPFLPSAKSAERNKNLGSVHKACYVCHLLSLYSKDLGFAEAISTSRQCILLMSRSRKISKGRFFPQNRRSSKQFGNEAELRVWSLYTSN
jgi:hypothetical protein